MKETRAHKLGRKIAENIFEMGNLFYNNNTKANFFRGVMRGLMKNDWIAQIAAQILKKGK